MPSRMLYQFWAERGATGVGAQLMAAHGEDLGAPGAAPDAFPGAASGVLKEFIQAETSATLRDLERDLTAWRRRSRTFEDTGAREQLVTLESHPVFALAFAAEAGTLAGLGCAPTFQITVWDWRAETVRRELPGKFCIF